MLTSVCINLPPVKSPPLQAASNNTVGWTCNLDQWAIRKPNHRQCATCHRPDKSLHTSISHLIPWKSKLEPYILSSLYLIILLRVRSQNNRIILSSKAKSPIKCSPVQTIPPTRDSARMQLDTCFACPHTSIKLDKHATRMLNYVICLDYLLWRQPSFYIVY